jgi:hypothetical protein
LALAASATLGAQTPAAAPDPMAAVSTPPTILQVEQDNIKPYQQEPYDKIAAAYVPVVAKAKLPGTVIALEALSGAPRAIYLFGYGSFDEMQKDEDNMMKTPGLMAQFATLDARESAYVTEVHNTIWHYRDDLSNNTAASDIPHCRYWETITFHIKPGHDAEFEGLIKKVKETYAKIGVNLSWATYESEMGATDTYNIIVPMKSLKEEDDALARDKTFAAALGAEGQHHMDEVASNTYLSVEDTLWEVNGKSSYVPKEFAAADPDLWAPKSPAPMAKTTTAKPAAKPAATTPPAQ